MELRHLRYFRVVAEQGNFSRAAEALHYTQPALSRTIKDLEEELGVSLFTRDSNSVRLTPAGETFYDEVLDCLARIDLAVRRVENGATRERLRIGYTPSIAAGVVPPAVARFREARPTVQIEWFELSDEALSTELRASRIDVAVSALRAGINHREIEWTEAGWETTTLVLPVGHPLARLKSISPKRLVGEPLIGFHRSLFPEYYRSVRRKLTPFGVTPDFVEEANGVISMFAAILSRQASALLSTAVEEFLPSRLTMRPFRPAFPPVPLGVGMGKVDAKPDAVLLRQFLTEPFAGSR
ncbi:MAG TPA: LysR substrate-binding domain-containing protein [Chthoniobacterales bacterium]|jgi:DNA-binding transcriptional LysR family regulator